MAGRYSCPYGLADIIYETFALVSWYGDTTLEQRNEFYEWLEKLMMRPH